VCCPNFCNRSSDWFQFSPLIEIDVIFSCISVLILLIFSFVLNPLIFLVYNLYYFQFCPAIEINYILYFHFVPYSFNFGFDFKSFNMFGIEILIIVKWILQLKSYFIFISALTLLIILLKFNFFISIYMVMH
jgi:hypothetical protein